MAPLFSTGEPRIEFLKKLSELKVLAVCGREYVQIEKLQEWMTLGKPKNVDRLLESCRKQQHRFSIDANKFVRGDKKCLLVFSILLELKEGDLIHDVRDRGLVDARLPLDLASLTRIWKGKTKLAQRFNEAQWKYVPLKFDFQDQETVAEADRIIPICLKEEINKGGTAVVHQILVQAEFVSKSLREAVPSSRYEDKIHGPSYFFALKTYNDGNESLFENETNAFRGLSNNSGMIQWLFNYSHVEDEKEGRTTYNLVLEYGEYDLEEYFKAHLPPQLQTEQLAFWHDLFLVADSIRNIHNFQVTDSSGAVIKDYFGWHADIKPANILNVRGEFKLADPGFARFEVQGDRNKPDSDGTILLGVTESFGAPECYVEGPAGRKRAVRVSRTIDIWSLGCVFSIAATWVVYGQQGLEQFADLRSEAITRIHPDRVASHEGGGVIGSDCFHDGQVVLEDVLHWHEFLRRGIRRSDVLTEKLLQLVEGKMLLKDPACRIEAEQLCVELKEILENVKTAGSELKPLRGSIQGALNRTEQKWAAQTRAEAEAAASSPFGNLGQTALLSPFPVSKAAQAAHKSRVLTPMQTSHRSKVIGGPSVTLNAPSRVFIARSTDDTSSRLVVQSPETEEEARPPYEQRASEGSVSLSNPEQSPLSRSPTLPSNLDRTGTNLTFVTSPVNSRRSRTLSIISKVSPWKKKGDEVLRRHYFDRDIVYLVDNGGTMDKFWPDVTRLLLELVTKSQHIDDNGMELKFTCSDPKFRPSNKPQAFAAEMDKPTNQPMAGKHARQTNMSITLGHILDQYFHLYSQKKLTRKMTVIVLTDGLWPGMTNNLAVDNKIVEFSQNLVRAGGDNLEHDERRVSIQFVRFGNDPAAIRRLQRLDDQLKFKGVPDIVDTRTCDDDNYDIFLGSLTAYADQKGEDETVQSDTSVSSDLGHVQSRSSGRTLSSEAGMLMEEPSELELSHASPSSLPENQRTASRTHTLPHPHRTNSRDRPRQPSISFSHY